jgi:hypothetical protein
MNEGMAMVLEKSPIPDSKKFYSKEHIDPDLSRQIFPVSSSPEWCDAESMAVESYSE